MSLFSVVQFPNEECTGSAATSTYGTCYTRHIDNKDERYYINTTSVHLIYHIYYHQLGVLDAGRVR